MNPERGPIVEVSLGKPPEDESEVRLTTEFELENIPTTAKELGEIIERRINELRLIEVEQKDLGRGVLSKKIEGIKAEDMPEEATFVGLLGTALDEFRAEHGIPAGRMPTLPWIAGVLKGSLETMELTPEETIMLADFIHDKFGVPTDEDINIPGEENPMTNLRMREESREKLLAGLTDAWRTLLVASWKHYYAERFPGFIRETVTEAATENTAAGQQEVIANLTDRASRFPANRFRVFLRALIEEGIGPTKTRVLSKAELEQFATFVSARLPAESALPESEIVGLMTDASQKGGSVVPKQKLGTIIEGFAANLRAVYELADPNELGLSDSPEEAVTEGWASFTNTQRLLFVDLVRGYYTYEPLAVERKTRLELRDLCRKLGAKLRSGTEVTKQESARLAKFVATRASAVAEFITTPKAPAPENETEEERESRESGEKKASPQEVFADVRARLSVPHAHIPSILKPLLKPEGEQMRLDLYKIIARSIMDGKHIPGLPKRIGREPSPRELDALDEVRDSMGASSNASGWEILLSAANKMQAFRKEMAGN